jgi:uncharacterized membrane protein
MALQETIKTFTKQYEEAINFVLNILWFIIQVVVVFGVIALLYEGGFIGASIILFKLLQIFALGTIIFTIIWLYLKLISYLFKKVEPRQKARREQFKQELKKEILKELNGRRKK